MTDPNEPLPEPKWEWRRLFVFVCTAGVFIPLWWLIRHRILPEDAPDVVNSLLMLLAVQQTYYLIAPSADEIVRMLANLKLKVTSIREGRQEPPREDRRDDDRPRPPMPPRPR